MSIAFDAKNGIFSLQTKNTSYQIKISSFGHLLHAYYGERLADADASFGIVPRMRSFSNVPHENDACDYSTENLPQEFSTAGVGDYRIGSMALVNADGSYAFDGKYKEHKIYAGKYVLPGLPGLRAIDGEHTDSLEITIEDAHTGVQVILLYAVFEEKDMICRAVRVKNGGTGTISLRRIMSVTLDFLPADFDILHFWGHHNTERAVEREHLVRGVISHGSNRGETSLFENNSLILCDRNATEDHGDCYGFSFMYSGNFLFSAERTTYDDVRVVMGIHPEQFEWRLEAGERFTAPEVVMSYSADGLTGLSHNYHDAYRENLCRSKYMHCPRPVLVNNWEATRMNFDGEKLLAIAKEATEMGVDLFVLDDGWFGARNSDRSGLGDWVVNEQKLGGTLGDLVQKINALGLKFGLWFEPEMINEDSALYRAHPDWALSIPGRAPALGRHQLVLDFSRVDVQEYIIKAVNDVLDSANIEYVKWDFNRVLTDVYSRALDKTRQGEVFHRFVLGLYHVMDEIMWKHPDILFEGCSGGGGRFDAAMLYYQPQIWCSDNTDAIDRLFIQYGTSFFYPISAVGAHVSVSPNIRTFRDCSFETRSIVAMNGTFGYELDTTRLSKEEKAFCKAQSEKYRSLQSLIFSGDYYRVQGPYDQKDGLTVWNYVSKDRSTALVGAVLMDPSQHDVQLYARVKGLERDALYTVEGSRLSGRYSGAALEKIGIPLAVGRRAAYTGYQFLLKKV